MADTGGPKLKTDIFHDDGGTDGRSGGARAVVDHLQPGQDQQRDSIAPTLTTTDKEGDVNSSNHLRFTDSTQIDGGKSLEDGQPKRESIGRGDMQELTPEEKAKIAARNNRKSRDSIISKRAPPRSANAKARFKRVMTNIWHMCSTCPYWDMSFYSGWSYSIGSVLFVMDGAWAWQPLVAPHSPLNFEGQEKTVGALFFVGALFYQIGATMAYLEAINDGSFEGSAMRRFLDGDQIQKELLNEHLKKFFRRITFRHGKSQEEIDEEAMRKVDPEAGWKARDRQERPGSIYPAGKHPPARRGGLDMGPSEQQEGATYEYLTWRWWPTWHALKTFHLKELGYVACAIQLFGATLYGMCGIVALPGILDTLKFWQALGAYWVPQTVASCCFLTAGIMFTLMTQDKWYRPVPSKIGWWIGAWATVGSIGFLLSAVFGIAGEHYSWCEYQSSLSSMWGSAGYLCSSLLQWYLSINQHPVLAFPNNPARGGMY